MAVYLVKRVIYCLITLFAIAFVSFAIISIYPGDFFTPYKLQAALQGLDPDIAHSEALALRGLDKPWIVQFLLWAEGVFLRLDLGYSFETGMSVNQVLFGPRSGLGWTLVIVTSSVFLAFLFGIPFGILAALNYRNPIDRVLTGVSDILAASPPQVLGALFILSIYTLIDPLICRSTLWGLCHYSLWDTPLTWTKAGSHVIHLLPAWIIVGAPVFSLVARYLRLALLGVFGEAYLATARARGLREVHVLIRHALPNAVNPLVTTVGYITSITITNSILATIFLGLPTFGMTLVDALKRQDQPVIAGIFMVYGVLTLAGNLIAEFILLAIDPRIRIA